LHLVARRPAADEPDQLFVDASESVQKEFETRIRGSRRDPRPDRTRVQRTPVRGAEDVRYPCRCHDAGHPAVQCRQLTEQRLAEFAEAKEFDRTAIALSYLCELPVELVERVLVNKKHEQLLVITKSIGLSWQTTKAILMLHPADAAAQPDDTERAYVSFSRLQPKTRWPPCSSTGCANRPLRRRTPRS